MKPDDTVDPKALALRLEARWNDTRAAWERLKVKEQEAKDDIKARKSEIEAIQSAIDSIIREDHEDVRLAFQRIQDFRTKADKRLQSLDSATKRHKAELEKRRAALELLLSSDMSQLPLLLPDLSVVTDLHIKGQLLIVGDPVEVKGVDDVLWFVRGFRIRGEGDERAEVVVLEDETGNELEANPEDLSRPEQDLKAPKPKGEDAEPVEDPSTIFGGICIGDGVSHKTAGTVGRVVDYAKGSRRVVVVWEGSDATPRQVSPNNLKIVEKSSTKPTKRIAFKLGDAVSTADGRAGKIVAILTKASDRNPDGKMRTFPGKVQVQIEGEDEDEPSTFHARTLRRWKRPAK